MSTFLHPISPDLRSVLDAVRATGQSAHPLPGHDISDLVYMVASFRHVSPLGLQREVDRYADALDALNQPTVPYLDL